LQDKIFQNLKDQLEELVGELVERTRMLVTLVQQSQSLAFQGWPS